MNDGYFKQAWLVLFLSLLFGGTLAGVQIQLQNRISDNKLNETLSQIPALVSGATSGEAVTVDGQLVYRAVAGDKQIGWVVPAGGQGFADRIEVLIGLTNGADQITGIYVLEQKETPGLGNKIIDSAWRDQFADVSTSQPLRVTKTSPQSPEEILSVTGATISSESVCDIVNSTVADMQNALAAQARE